MPPSDEGAGGYAGVPYLEIASPTVRNDNNLHPSVLECHCEAVKTAVAISQNFIKINGTMKGIVPYNVTN